MRWLADGRVLIADEGNRYSIDVAPAYRKAAPGLAARIVSPLVAPFERGLGQLVGLIILAVGLLVYLRRPALDGPHRRSQARKRTPRVSTRGETWAAVVSWSK